MMSPWKKCSCQGENSLTNNKCAILNKLHTGGKTEENNLGVLAHVFGTQEYYILGNILFNPSSGITKITI